MFNTTGRARSLLPAALVARRLGEAFPGVAENPADGTTFAVAQGTRIPMHLRAVVSATLPPRVDYQIETGSGNLGLMLVLIACVPALVAGLYALLGGPLPAPGAPGWVVLAVLVLSLVYAGGLALVFWLRLRLAERRLLAVVGAR